MTDRDQRMTDDDIFERYRSDKAHRHQALVTHIVPAPFQNMRSLVEIANVMTGERRAAHEGTDAGMRDQLPGIGEQRRAQHLRTGGQVGNQHIQRQGVVGEQGVASRGGHLTDNGCAKRVDLTL